MAPIWAAYGTHSELQSDCQIYFDVFVFCSNILLSALFWAMTDDNMALVPLTPADKTAMVHPVLGEIPEWVLETPPHALHGAFHDLKDTFRTTMETDSFFNIGTDLGCDTDSSPDPASPIHG